MFILKLNFLFVLYAFLSCVWLQPPLLTSLRFPLSRKLLHCDSLFLAIGLRGGDILRKKSFHIPENPMINA